MLISDYCFPKLLLPAEVSNKKTCHLMGKPEIMPVNHMKKLEVCDLTSRSMQKDEGLALREPLDQYLTPVQISTTSPGTHMYSFKILKQNS